MIKTPFRKLFFIGLFSISLLVVPIFSVQATSHSSAGTCANFDRPTDTLCNPLPDKNAQELVIRLLKWLMTVIAMIAVVAVVISGFRMVVSGGSEQEVKGAKKMLTWSIIGLVIASLAYSIVALTQNILTGR